MGLVEEFLARYRREQDFYQQAAELSAQLLGSRIRAEGIRALVTHRAKDVVRLEAKVRDRAQRKNYAAVDDIYNDLVDLAGVRVALYFPGQDDELGRLIADIFTVIQHRSFPESVQSKYGTYERRFSGYGATHYRVRLKEAALTDSQKRYSDAQIEIQVASVLMHAWSEVEHDLVYKPLQGELSIDEYSVLDELNGLVIAGEIALERLQRAGEARVASTGRFNNHYELATYLLREATSGLQAGLEDAALGRVDLLFEFLRRLNMASPTALAPLVEELHEDFERRPLAEQVTDRLLLQGADRYKIYDEVRASKGATVTDSGFEGLVSEFDEAVGVFLNAWIELERFVRESALPSKGGVVGLPTARILQRMADIAPGQIQEFERVRRMRNSVVHGIEMPAVPDLLNAAKFLRQLTTTLRTPA